MKANEAGAFVIMYVHTSYLGRSLCEFTFYAPQLPADPYEGMEVTVNDWSMGTITTSTRRVNGICKVGKMRENCKFKQNATLEESERMSAGDGPPRLPLQTRQATTCGGVCAWLSQETSLIVPDKPVIGSLFSPSSSPPPPSLTRT